LPRGRSLNIKEKGFAKREAFNYEGERFCQKGKVEPSTMK
jgi:hypothetical protein